MRTRIYTNGKPDWSENEPGAAHLTGGNTRATGAGGYPLGFREREAAGGSPVRVTAGKREDLRGPRGKRP